MPILIKWQAENCYQRFDGERGARLPSVSNYWKMKDSGYEKLEEETMTNSVKIKNPSSSKKKSVINAFRKLLKKNRCEIEKTEAVFHIPVDTPTINKGTNLDDFDINPGLDLVNGRSNSELLIDFEAKMVNEDRSYVNLGYFGGQMNKADSTSSSSSSGSPIYSARPRLTRQNAVSEDRQVEKAKLERKDTVIEIKKSDNGASTATTTQSETAAKQNN